MQPVSKSRRLADQGLLDENFAVTELDSYKTLEEKPFLDHMTEAGLGIVHDLFTDRKIEDPSAPIATGAVAQAVRGAQARSQALARQTVLFATDKASSTRFTAEASKKALQTQPQITFSVMHKMIQADPSIAVSFARVLSQDPEAFVKLSKSAVSEGRLDPLSTEVMQVGAHVGMRMAQNHPEATRQAVTAAATAGREMLAETIQAKKQIIAAYAKQFILGDSKAQQQPPLSPEMQQKINLFLYKKAREFREREITVGVRNIPSAPVGGVSLQPVKEAEHLALMPEEQFSSITFVAGRIPSPKQQSI